MKKINLKFNKKTMILIGIIIVILLIIGLIIGVMRKKISSSSPVGLTEAYLEKYNKVDKSLTSKITYPFSDKLNSYQEQRYKEVIKNQYRKMKYNILDEYVGELDANMNVQVTVIDLKEAYDKANSYVIAHKDKFLDKDGNYDEKKAIDYKLKQLETADDTIEYSILVTCYKNDLNQWVLSELSPADIEKINGTF